MVAESLPGADVLVALKAEMTEALDKVKKAGVDIQDSKEEIIRRIKDQVTSRASPHQDKPITEYKAISNLGILASD